MKGILITLYGASKVGKTSSITLAAQKLGLDCIYAEDFSGIAPCLINGKKIGFASMGDPYSAQEERINQLIAEGCTIIVCASRTKGSTVDVVAKAANQNDYGIIWGTPFYGLSDHFSKEMHMINADAVVALINLAANEILK